MKSPRPRPVAALGGTAIAVAVATGCHQSRPEPGGITINWREPDPSRIVATIPGRVPIQGRSVSLDISAVAAGDYSLIVTIARPGSAFVAASRDFWISR